MANRQEVIRRLERVAQQLKGFRNSERLWKELLVICQEAIPHLTETTRIEGNVCGTLDNRYKLIYRNSPFRFDVGVQVLESVDDPTQATFSLYQVRGEKRLFQKPTYKHGSGVADYKLVVPEANLNFQNVFLGVNCDM